MCIYEIINKQTFKGAKYLSNPGYEETTLNRGGGTGAMVLK